MVDELLTEARVESAQADSELPLFNRPALELTLNSSLTLLCKGCM